MFGASNQCLPGRSKSDVLRPGITGMRGSMVMRLQPYMAQSPSPPLPSHPLPQLEVETPYRSGEPQEGDGCRHTVAKYHALGPAFPVAYSTPPPPPSFTASTTTSFSGLTDNDAEREPYHPGAVRERHHTVHLGHAGKWGGSRGPGLPAILCIRMSVLILI